ncbi:flagellar biosynthetic protein FlhB [Oleiphilus sp. HI0117]|nr:flagellar biosynthetic protein FlhB [Oleiphilus sp. HI0117]
MIVGAGGLLIFGSGIAASLTKIMTASFSFSREATQDTSQMGMYLARAAVEVAEGILPFLILLFVSAIAGSVALGGWLFSTKALAPKFSRMDPIKGLAKMFSLKSLVELIKAIAKVSLVVAVAVLIIHSQLPTLIGLADQNVISAMETASKILGWGFFYLACTMIVIAMIDVPFQIFDHTKNLKMTKQEVKDEFKDTEGKPEVKRKIRQLQMEMAQRRMMQDVPQADVVITNPTHFSVALRYKPEEDAAPILLAKGHDQVALKIREIANEHDVEIVEAPPLARSVYHHAEIGQEIPSGLYMAVAQVLAYVFQLKQFRRRVITKPPKPDFPIPDDLKYDGS